MLKLSSLMNIYQHLGEDDEEEVIKEEYENIDGISIDFGVMQRTRKAYVIKGNFKWDDIGSFNALSRYLNEKDVYLQLAILYTTEFGERRIRLFNQRLLVTETYSQYIKKYLQIKCINI